MATVILLASSQLALGRRAELLQDRDSPSGAPSSRWQKLHSNTISTLQARNPWPLMTSPSHFVLPAFCSFCSAIIRYKGKNCIPTSFYSDAGASIADAAAGSAFQFPSVAIPGSTGLLTSGAPAAAEAPGMAEAAAPLGATAAAPAPGTATATMSHVDQQQMRRGTAEVTQHASCFHATRDLKSSNTVCPEPL